MPHLQTEFQNGPKTELGWAADEYIEHYHEIVKHKEALKPIGDRIMIELKKEGRTAFAIPYNDGRIKFEIKKNESLKVSGFAAKKVNSKRRRTVLK